MLDHALPPLAALEQPASDREHYVFRDENVLGTRMLLAFVADSFGAAQEAAFAVRAEIDRLRLILDERDAGSELSRLNRSSRHEASPELFEVISRAEYWHRISRGAFSPRLGRVLALWRNAAVLPSRETLREAAQLAASANVALDASTRTIVRPDAVVFSLDAFAKGWIVDRAFDAACRIPGVTGALIDIGGDIRCGGRSPETQGWRVGIADLPYDNAPLVATVQLKDRAIATSGRGPRDRHIDGETRSSTISPFTGWPIATGATATVIAANAADADALATAALVTDDTTSLAGHYTALRLSDDNGVRVEPADASTFAASTIAKPSAAWPENWQALATFTAPRRQLIRDPNFRSPYMAMWITDPDNRPVRTLLLVGKRADWQKDNYIWWSINRATTERLVTTRSVSTSGSGVYNVFWDGVDDQGQTVAAGKYVLHVETSRERGQHTYRSLTLDLGNPQRFVQELPPTEEGGGLRVSFDRY